MHYEGIQVRGRLEKTIAGLRPAFLL